MDKKHRHKVRPTLERLQELFTCHSDTGILLRNISRGNAKAGALVGTISTHGHLTTEIDGRQFQVHQIIWCMHYGVWPSLDLDHRNRVPNDNRIANLREVTVSANISNAKPYKRKVNQLPPGIYPSTSGKFKARLGGGGSRYLGTFDTIEAAVRAVELGRANAN